MTLKIDDIYAVRAALEAHRVTARLEDGHGPEVDVYHLLASLITFCDVEKIDLDATLEEVRRDSQL